MTALLRPSKAPVWVPCPGSVTMELMYPGNGEESEAAREGTAAHEVAARMVDMLARAQSINYADFIGKHASNGVIIDGDMCEGAEFYARDVQAVMREHSVFGGRNLGIEAHVSAARRIHPENSGTTDCFLYARNAASLYVWDFKYGFGQVEAFENWQSVDYVAGLLERFDIDGIEDTTLRVHMRIVQPRPVPVVREWVVMASDLRGYINQMATAAAEALSDNPRTTSGRHCLGCGARHACETGRRAALSAVDHIGQTRGEELDADATGRELRALRRAAQAVEARLTALEEQAAAMIRRGEPVPFFSLRPATTRERWSVDPAEVIALGDMLGADLRAPSAAVTPAAARKIGVPDEVVAAYAVRPEGGLKLVLDDGRKARQVFAK